MTSYAERCRCTDGHVIVTDDGAGGARVTEGGGLAGLRERVDSPAGGPTTVTIELPRHA